MVGEGTRARPDRLCDIVMKGGITSGVVYPHAVCELAATYRLKNVGGTSAGAIAAAAAAAAEYGRERGGFEELAKLPDEIGADGKLASLFQPARSTRALFKLMLTAVEHRGGARLPALAVALLRRFPVPALLGALPGLALLALAWLASADDLVVALAMTVAAVLLAAIGAYGAVAYRVVGVARTAIPANDYGICSGMPGAADVPSEALTPVAGAADRRPRRARDRRGHGPAHVRRSLGRPGRRARRGRPGRAVDAARDGDHERHEPPGRAPAVGVQRVLLRRRRAARPVPRADRPLAGGAPAAAARSRPPSAATRSCCAGTCGRSGRCPTPPTCRCWSRRG